MMKKLLAGITLLVAFSFTSVNANIILDSNTPCADQWSQDVNALQNAGFGLETSIAIADLDFEDCMDATY